MLRKEYSVFSLAVVIVMVGPCLYCGAVLGREAETEEVIYNLYFDSLHKVTTLR